jgi:PiT family inorganic phosphate transporter
MLLTTIVLALLFDFINGFHDASLSIATVVSTKVLNPFQAILWAAFFNFAAFFIFRYFIGEYRIAHTITHFISRNFITLPVIFSGLVAAILWNLLTWWFGIPSSSSHTLLGGFVGAALAHAGGLTAHGEAVINYTFVIPTFLFIVLAPVISMALALVITILTVNLFRRGHPYKLEKGFRRFQLLTSAMLSLAHGGNDAQKVLGIITVAMIATGKLDLISQIPYWVPVSCFAVIAFGTLSGGWRIVRTMDTRITKLNPLEGTCAETAAVAALFLTQILGIPVSTTHTVTGAMIGAGATRRMSAVRWGVSFQLTWAWGLTIPISAALAAMVYGLCRFFHPI